MNLSGVFNAPIIRGIFFSVRANELSVGSISSLANNYILEGSIVNKKRPVNLDIGTMKLPITAYASIAHRVSGVILLLGVAVLLWMLDTSLASEAGLQQVKDCLASPLAKFVVWFVLVGLAYHMIAGVRHLLMDLGVGETLEGGKLGAKIVFVLSLVAAVAIAGWLV